MSQFPKGSKVKALNRIERGCSGRYVSKGQIGRVLGSRNLDGETPEVLVQWKSGVGSMFAKDLATA